MQPEPSAKAPKADESGVVYVERPASGLARGKYPAPAWLIGFVGISVVAVVVVYFILRIRKARLK